MSGIGSGGHRRAEVRGRRIRPRTALGRVGLALALVLFGQLVLWPGVASASVTLIVTTTTDIAANAGDCGSSSTTVPSPLSLREATCIANNYGSSQAVTITVPAGHYTLTSGELAPGTPSGSNVTINGAGAASTIIDGNHASRVFDIDKNTVGSVTASISGVTITNGADSSFGGAGILDGSGSLSNTDSLTISNSVISNNVANAAAQTSTINPGGGLAMVGGSLTMTNVTVSGNNSYSSAGSGVYFQAFGAAAQSLTITGSTFSGNSTANSGSTGISGGALGLVAGSGLNTPYTVSNTSFTGNTSTSTGGEKAVGAAIFEQSGNLTVTGSTFTSNSVGGATAQGGPILYTAGTAALHYDRMVGNTGTGGVMTNNSVTVDASEDWWGCNTGPNTTGCETTSGTGITATPRLVLTSTASPAHVVGPNGTATITASLLTDSASGAVSASNLGAFAGLPVSFADPPGDATVAGSAGAHSVNLAGGVASISYQSNTTLGPDNDNTTLDNATTAAVLEVDEPPTITSANTAAFTVGTANTFTITTTGYPNAVITETGSLPSGLTFHDNGNGSATISGTAAAATGGNYPLNLTAANGYLPNATQTLTLNVSQAPAFTSPATATFVIGTAGSFSVTTSGFPTVSTITESGTLPAGVTFTDNGGGTATIAGTPTGTGNTYPVTLTASNGVTPNAIQNLTIQVNQAPVVTLNPTDQTVPPGNPVTFTAAASGVPTPTVQWQVSTDGGTSFTNIAGATSTSYTFTVASGDNGNQYRAVFSNGVGSPATTTAATLTAGSPPAFTSADNTSFVVGQAGSFAITTTGVPSATLSRTGTQFPATWLTLTDNGDGTGTLTGTPPAGSAGTYVFTLKAANGVGTAASQNFTLFVDDSPVITSADHTTFTAGQAGSFAVTTTAGFPTTTGITESGSLPSGVTFHDNGDGTATLAGTPAAGTGGTYPITITATATGGLAAPATQSFTLTVLAPPVITSANHATFSEGNAGSFTVTTTAGNPAATTITESGGLPSGVTFTDNGDGTATIAGTPNAGSGGVYAITITASNGITPDATQSFTLTVNTPPLITSADHVTFTQGAAAAFTVTTTGSPAPALSETGSLPPGVTFTDNGDGTATLGGTPTSSGSFTFTITASNGVLPNATQTFTATVNSTPVITSADHATFAVGTAGTFTVTTTPGNPATTTITETGALPTGVSFTDNGDGTATLAGTPAAGTGGTYAITITASNGVLPNPTQNFTLTVTELPTITSVDHTAFTVGSAGSFTVTTHAGFPSTTSITETGALPTGVTFTDNADGTATLAGTPAAGTGGSYPLTLSAINAAGHTDQAFTLTVSASPVITSADHTTFAVGSAGSFTVTTTAGTPASTTITESGVLPSGVTFTDNGDGTATLAGTPAAGSGGSYPITITASNGVPPNGTQSFTLTVTELPAFTSADHTAFTVGSAGSFTVTTHAGFPVATTLAETGALPSGVTFTDNADGTATLSGTPAAGTGGSYPLTLTATNTVGHTDQAFTLTVSQTPAITSADHTTFAVGSAGSFTVTTTAGTPASTTITESGSLPSGVTFHDNGDGTATLAGTPAAGTGGTYPITITASNGVLPNPTQSFTLTVTELPAITSANHTTFVVGSAGTFSVTSHAGFPAATTLTETGSLPSGVTFHDNGNGTATLSGTPAAGSGGSYSLTLTATNTAGHTSQAFTLTVGESPTITSFNQATFTVNHAGTFGVTTSGGFPTPPALSETGALPTGVTFHDNGNGTATLAGTPTVGGIFHITITANNGVAPAATQSFTLTVNGPPVFTSASSYTVLLGSNRCFSFKVTTTAAGSPGPTHITESGKMPGGVSFHDNGDGTATLGGCVTGVSNKTTFKLTFTATNSAGYNTQKFSLTVIPPGGSVVSLTSTQPTASGTLVGMPAHTAIGQEIHLSGSGFAAGTPITIGYYPGKVTLTTSVRATLAGTFSVDIRTNVLGNHTYVAAGIGSNGQPRYLEYVTYTAYSSSSGSPHWPNGGGVDAAGGGGLPLADTGPGNLRLAAGFALAALLAGLGLMVIGRRRRPDGRTAE